MRTRCFILFLSACVLLLQQSCYVPHYMYAPAALQTPGFTGKNQSEVNASLSQYGYDLRGGYAVSNHLAVLGSWYWRHERQYDNQYYPTALLPPSPLRIDSIRYKRDQLTFGISYFTPLNLIDKKHFFFTMTGGYGAGHFGMNEIARIKHRNYDTTEQVYSYQYHAGIKDIFFQPSFMFNSKYFKIILSVRRSEINFHDINTTYTPDTFNISKNKFYGFTEPAITVQVHPNIDWLTVQFQGGISIRSTNVSFDSRPIIGNIGISVDPVKLFAKKDRESR